MLSLPVREAELAFHVRLLQQPFAQLHETMPIDEPGVDRVTVLAQVGEAGVEVGGRLRRGIVHVRLRARGTTAVRRTAKPGRIIRSDELAIRLTSP
jgi:hypothetical protein